MRAREKARAARRRGPRRDWSAPEIDPPLALSKIETDIFSGRRGLEMLRSTYVSRHIPRPLMESGGSLSRQTSRYRAIKLFAKLSRLHV